MIKNIIFKCCVRIGHKDDACIIHGPKFLQPSLKRNMNQFNTLHGEEPNEPTREWNSQPPPSHFKSSASSSNTSPLFSAIMGRLNNHDIDNGDVNFHTSEFPVEFNS